MRCDPAADQGWTGSSSCARAYRRQAPLHPDARKLQRARELYEKQEISVAESMALTGFASRYSFYKYVIHAEADALSIDKKGKRPKKTEGRENEGREKKEKRCISRSFPHEIAVLWARSLFFSSWNFALRSLLFSKGNRRESILWGERKGCVRNVRKIEHARQAMGPLRC